MYCCPDGQPSVYAYGRRTYIKAPEDNDAQPHPYTAPFVQFIFRGEETVDGMTHRDSGGKNTSKSFGDDTQCIDDEHHVSWTEMTVYIGIPNRTASHYSVMHHAPYADGTRRCRRLTHDLNPLVIEDRRLPPHMQAAAQL